MRGATSFTLLALAVLTAACRPPIRYTEGLTSRQNVITRDEMTQAQADNVYNAVQKLHPEWLTPRGVASMTDSTGTSMGENWAVPSVVMFGQTMGQTDYLQQVRPEDVDEVRYFTAAEASVRFGMGHQRGAIEIVPRGGGG